MRTYCIDRELCSMLCSDVNGKEIKKKKRGLSVHIELIHFALRQKLTKHRKAITCVLVAQSCLTLCDAMDYSPPGSPSTGSFRQEYWSGWPFSSPGDLPHPGIEPGSPALQADSLLSESPVQFSRSVVSDFLRPHESQPGKPLKAKILG